MIGVACGEPRTAEETDTDTDAASAQAAGAQRAGGTPAAAGGSGEESGLIHNTPEGGLLDWVADIDAGLDTVAVLVGTDPAGAQSQVLNLYVMRQEYLEMYYGPGGRLEATPELADAIEANEARFHALMQELAREAPDSARVVALADSLSGQVSRVRAAAEAVGRELTPWSGTDS